MKPLEVLDTVYWDFDTSLTYYGIHKIHWYPASFVPQIPSILISLLSKPSDTILDPFCGGGTTLVEAIKVRRKCIGIDFFDLAELISRAKTTFVSLNELESTFDDIIIQIKSEWKRNQLLDITEVSNIPKEILNKYIPYVFQKNEWYHPKTLFQIGLILKVINKEPNEEIKRVLLVALSSRLKSLSSQKNHWGYIADNMVPKSNTLLNENAINDYQQTLKKYKKIFHDYYNNLNINENSLDNYNQLCKIYNGDCRELRNYIEENSIDFVMTSPPYANSTDYVRAHRLSDYWLGYNINILDKTEIGARWKRKRTNCLDNYINDMKLCFSEISKVIKPNGTMCIVLGSPKKLWNKQPIEEVILTNIIPRFDFKMIKSLTRRLANQRIAAKKIKTEQIVIYKKV